MVRPVFVSGNKPDPRDEHGARHSGKVSSCDPFSMLFGAPREWLILEHAMKAKRQFDTREAAQQKAFLIWRMMADIDRQVRLLDCDIATEEERTGISDRSEVAYPVLARMLAKCRDKLDTTTPLEQRLSGLDQAFFL
jgi:hypothetical protein